MADSIPSKLEEALSHLVTVSPRDATKGKYVSAWIHETSGEQGRASVVSEKKQVYNRIVEQFKHEDPHVIFVYYDNDTFKTLYEQTKLRTYSGLRTVLFIQLVDKKEFRPTNVLYGGASKLEQYYRKQFPEIRAEELPDVTKALESQEGVNLKSWDILEIFDDNPCGLISLGPQFRKAISALKSGKHVILIGPPGTGKTELALCICKSLAVPYDLVTATADWTTFDTVGGYMPMPSNTGGASVLDFSPGIVIRSLEEGRWLIIDEINRTDVDKSFGELFTVLGGETTTLPFKKIDGDKLLEIVIGKPNTDKQNIKNIPYPEDWRIIGTMNTFDKASLFQLSYAFMRRFAFIEVPVPRQDDYKIILEETISKILNTSVGAEYQSTCLEYLNAVFSPGINEGLAKIDLSVGPAIPIDIVKYLEKHLSTMKDAKEPIEINTFILEALEMYLYPQYEGQDRKHPDILESLASALELSEMMKQRTDKMLATWTGFIKGE